jgi:hypothetical protein
MSVNIYMFCYRSAIVREPTERKEHKPSVFKHLGVDTYHKLYFIICILFYVLGEFVG